MERVSVVLCVDVEPDERYPAPGQATWHGYDWLWNVLASERAPFAEATGAPVNWAWFLRMDPQIRITAGSADAVARLAPGRLDSMRTSGDTIGIHAHAVRLVGGDRWAVDHADVALVEDAVTSALEVFRRTTGDACRTFRFGIRWMDGRTMRLLDSLGVCVDLSIEPGHFGVPSGITAESCRGTWPDARRAPRRAYRPSFEDPAREDPSRTGGIVEIPVATAPKGRWWTHARRAAKELVAPSRRRDRAVSLDLALPTHVFRDVFDRALGAGTNPMVVVVRTGFPLPETCRCVAENLQAIRRHPAAPRFRMVTPEDAVAGRDSPEPEHRPVSE